MRFKEIVKESPIIKKSPSKEKQMWDAIMKYPGKWNKEAVSNSSTHILKNLNPSSVLSLIPIFLL